MKGTLELYFNDEFHSLLKIKVDDEGQKLADFLFKQMEEYGYLDTDDEE